MVLLQNGSREQIDPKTGRLDVLTFKRNTLSLAQAAKAGTPDLTDSAEAPLADLLHPEPSLTPAEQGKWLVEAQRRLTAPLTAHQLHADRPARHAGRRIPPPWRALRPIGAVIAVTLLVALGLGVNNFAARAPQPAAADLGDRVAARPGRRRACCSTRQAATADLACPSPLSIYFGRQFAIAVLVMLAALTALVALFDFLELLRESATAPHASFGIIVEMEFLRVPWTLLQILPFAVLLGGIFAFWRLSRSSELVVARAAGVSAWQFLAVPVLLATLLGALGTGAVSPLSAAHVWPRRDPLQCLSQGRRRPAFAQWRRALGAPGRSRPDAQTASRCCMPATSAAARQCAARRPRHRPAPQRPDQAAAAAGGRPRHAERRRLGPQPGQRAGAGRRRRSISRQLLFPTDLTVHRVQESFASPDSLSFWALPELHPAAETLRLLAHPA